MFSSSVESVITIQKKRAEREQVLKEKHVSMVKDRINNYANFGKTDCIYKIPNFLIGYIPYDILIINKYIYKKLKSEGFYVIKLNDEYIYISWDIKNLGKNEKDKKEDINFSAFINNNKSK